MLDIIIKATDKASSVIEGVSQVTDKATKSMNVNWTAVGAGVAAAGVAVEGLVRSQAPLTIQVEQLGNSLNMTTKEVRDLAIGVSDAGLSLEETLVLFKQGEQQGLKSADALEKYASFWDMVDDATGESAVTLAEAGVALQALGIDAENSEEALNAFGFMSRNTTMGIEEFLNFIQKTGPDLNAMGLDVDETAALLGALEKEFGMTGKTAKAEFTSAVKQSEGDMGKLLQTLGLSEQQFASYTEQVKASSDVIQENADISGSHFTLIEKAQHAVKELVFQYGDEIKVVGDLGGVLTGLGSTIALVSSLRGVFTTITSAGTIATIASTVATTAATVATTAFGIAMAIVTSPIFLVVAAIGALIAIGVLLYKNWDTVKEFALKVFGGIKDFFVNTFDKMKNSASGFKDFLLLIFKVLTAPLLMPIRINFMIANTIIDALNKISFDVPDWVPLIGGKHIGFNIPNLPKFHTGGVFRATEAGGEGLAILQDGERILDKNASSNYGGGSGGYRKANIYILLDGKTIGKSLGADIVDEIYVKGGARA